MDKLRLIALQIEYMIGAKFMAIIYEISKHAYLYKLLYSLNEIMLFGELKEYEITIHYKVRIEFPVFFIYTCAL